MGGLAAVGAAIFPTGYCIGRTCPYELTSTIHHICGIILFSTTVYFCLIAFRDQTRAKITKDERWPEKDGVGPKRRNTVYLICGWGIIVVMVGLAVATYTEFNSISNITFWAETAALELFGFAWAVASQYLPGVTDEKEQQKLF